MLLSSEEILLFGDGRGRATNIRNQVLFENNYSIKLEILSMCVHTEDFNIFPWRVLNDI